jgi:hypothetical protein
MRMALLGGTTLAVVAIAAILLWDGGGGRLPAPLPAEPASNSFVIHDAAPEPASPPAPAAQTAQPSSLDALMQKMRAGAGGATVVVTPSPAGSSAAAPGSPPAAPGSPAATASTVPTAPVSADPAAAPAAAPVPAPVPPTPLLPIATQWTNVTSQGVRWRFGRGATGFLLSIDLGGGQVADVHVQPAFLNLDTASVSTRVDYLKATILQNFSSASGTYSFARDGSVSIDR